jgi:integrase
VIQVAEPLRRASWTSIRLTRSRPSPAHSRTATTGRPSRPAASLFEDQRDSVASYCGLRLGELLALRWRDVDWTGSALTISRSLSSGIEGPTKSGHIRRVPLADQPAAPVTRPSRIASDLLYEHEDPEGVAQLIADSIRHVYDYPGTFADSLAPHAQRFGLRRGDGLVGDPDTAAWMKEARAHHERVADIERPPNPSTGGSAP